MTDDPSPQAETQRAAAPPRAGRSLAVRLGGGLGARFWRLLAASALANLADGIFWIALPLIAVSITDSPALVAGVSVASRLPWLLFSLIAGALADRLDRRRTMVIADLVRALLIGGLAIVVMLGTTPIALLYVVALVLGVLETLHDTASQTVLPVVVERERLGPANSRLFGVELLANQVVGPPIGGLLVAGGFATAFGTAAGGYVGAALLVASLTGRFRADRTGVETSMRTEIGEGLRYLAGHRLLATLALVVGGLNLAGGAVMGILVLYAVRPGPIGLDPVGFGVLLTVIAAGTVAGTLGAGPIARVLGRANLLAGAIVVLALQHATLALTTDPLVIALVLGSGGVLLGAFNPVYVSFRQRIVPDRLLGRVVATFRLVGLGSLPLGALAGGLVGEAFGLTAVFWVAALLTILLLPARLIVTDATLDAMEAAADATAGTADATAASG